jgi:hypothetical protein
MWHGPIWPKIPILQRNRHNQRPGLYRQTTAAIAQQVRDRSLRPDLLDKIGAGFGLKERTANKL